MNWDDDALYVAVDVRKPELSCASATAPAAPSRQRAGRHPRRRHSDLPPAGGGAPPCTDFSSSLGRRRRRDPRAGRRRDRRERPRWSAAPGSRPTPATRSPSRRRCRTGDPAPRRRRSASICWSTRCEPGRHGARASWCGAAAADGSISAATARIPASFGIARAALNGSRRGLHLDRQQAARGPVRCRRPMACRVRMTRSAGCPVWDSEGREYLDYIMGLGSVALGYGHPEVTRGRVGGRAARRRRPAAARAGGGAGGRSLPADPLGRAGALSQDRRGGDGRGGAAGPGRHRPGCGARLRLPRLARLVSDRARARGARRHPRALRASCRSTTPRRRDELIRAAGDRLAAVVFEPVILEAPDPEWLAVLREETDASGRAARSWTRSRPSAGSRLAARCERYGIRPDLVVMGKAIANGFPLAAVGGRADVMDAVSRTWISSTLATEFVSLAALAGHARRDRAARRCRRTSRRVGPGCWTGLQALAARTRARDAARRASRRCASSTIATRRSPGGSPRPAPRGASCSSAAPTTSCRWRTTRPTIDRTLGILDDALAAVARIRARVRASVLIDVHAHFLHDRTPRADWRERNASRLRAGERVGITIHVASILGSWGLTSPDLLPFARRLPLRQRLPAAAPARAPRPDPRVRRRQSQLHRRTRWPRSSAASTPGMIGIKLAASRRANDPLLDPICRAGRRAGRAGAAPHLAAPPPRLPGAGGLRRRRARPSWPPGIRRCRFLLAHIGGGGDWLHSLPGRARPAQRVRGSLGQRRRWRHARGMPRRGRRRAPALGLRPHDRDRLGQAPLPGAPALARRIWSWSAGATPPAFSLRRASLGD